MPDNKFVIVAKDGLARVGNDIIELEDLSKVSFETDDIHSFKEYIKSISAFALFYNANSIIAFPFDAEDPPNQNTVPLADLSLSQSVPLQKFKGAVINGFSLDQFELFLLEFRPFMDSTGLHLLSHIRDMRIEKITSIIRQKDGKGNFNFSITRKSAGKGDFTPPERIGFKLPVFEGLPDVLETSMELVFDFSENDEEEEKKVDLLFALRNFQLSEELRVRQKAIMEKQLDSFKQPKYWGSPKLVKQTDSWKYQKNSVG